MTIDSVSFSLADVQRLLDIPEGHFCDLKAFEVTPAKLTRTICAMANAEGGDVYVGIDDAPRKWRGL